MNSDNSNAESTDLGRRIRDARHEQRLRLVDVAARTGYSASFLSQVERGVTNPSVSALKRLADALGAPAAALLFGSDVTGERPQEKSPAGSNSDLPIVVRKDRRKSIRYPGSPHLYELVVPDLRRQMEVLWLEASPGASTGKDAYVHTGEECVLIIKGKLDITVGGQKYVLREGDAIYFQSELAHEWVNSSDETAFVVWISTPPTF